MFCRDIVSRTGFYILIAHSTIKPPNEVSRFKHAKSALFLVLILLRSNRIFSSLLHVLMMTMMYLHAARALLPTNSMTTSPSRASLEVLHPLTHPWRRIFYAAGVVQPVPWLKPPIFKSSK
ncbi:hypothetical protein BDQ12DRAFT_684085 [Crucibulum laeve]|uniref:Uncharacterized protein n=1 Tax=Crucibulum laeve TaxID=68775 RepID=A0A5C3MAJ3_9AGAR|nr:hypothetical protein BDQ12DRAFT_684085 [Crucibulum laeve]